jgi:hypothetical protein
MKGNNTWFYLLLILSGWGLFGCAEQWEADVPTFLKIDEFEFTTVDTQGSASSFIRDVWVYENNTFLGAYELPATVPIIGEGERQVTLFPGIREDGSSERPRLLFLYETDTFSFMSQAGEEIYYQPETRYDDRIQFSFIEDFEDGNLFTADLDGQDTTKLVRTMENVFEGDFSGKITVTDSFPVVVVGTANAYGPFLENGTQVFFEFDYNCTVPTTIGYIGQNAQGLQVDFLKVTLLPTAGWRKAYINFSEEFRIDQVVAAQMIIRVDLDDRFGETGSSGTALFDNLKVIHF